MRGPPPWHLWGGAQVLAVQPAVVASSVQLVRVQNHRPESWVFFAWCKVLDNAGGTVTGQIVVNFDVTIGVGRANFTIPGLIQLTPLVLNAPSNSIGAAAWAVAAPTTGQGVSSAGAFTLISQQIDRLPASDIQVAARITQQTALNAAMQVECGFFVSPFNTGTHDSEQDTYTESLPAGRLLAVER